MPTSWRTDTMVAAAQRPKRRRRGIHHATFHRSNRLGSNRLGLRVAVSAAAESGDFPRTAAGKPDFSGTYDLRTLTPYVRNEKHGENRHLDAAEAAEVEAAAAARMAAAYAPGDPNRSPPEKGVPIDQRSYDWFWMDPGDTMFKIDGKYRTSIIVDPPNGRLPPPSAAGQAHRAAMAKKAEGRGRYDDPELLTLHDRCLYLGHVTVPVRPVIYNNLKIIVQTEDHVLILVEWMHWARIVRLNGEHLPTDMRSLSGDSIGWWEDDTLVVETTNFLAAPGRPAEDLRVVERFSPLDANGLLYRFTVYDPHHAAPYSGELPWPKTDASLYEYACHEGNYSMANTLRGARHQERQQRQTAAAD